jgi:hypothetical protein
MNTYRSHTSFIILISLGHATPPIYDAVHSDSQLGNSIFRNRPDTLTSLCGEAGPQSFIKLIEELWGTICKVFIGPQRK